MQPATSRAAPERVMLINFGSGRDAEVQVALEADGYRVVALTSWEDGLAKTSLLRPKLIVARLDGRVGRDCPESLQSEAEILSEVAPLILVGSESALDGTENIVRAGAIETIAATVTDQVLLDCMRRRLAYPPRGDRASTPSLIGESRAFGEVVEQLELVAGRDTTVLITGETGSGKECVARAVHGLSRRAGRDLVSVNCAGVPATLLEDEFFGHVRGAFTDAHQDRAGRFEQAHRGTIFLDEIGDLPLELQPKLLRVLQEREFHRIGGVDLVSTDARVIAATNVDLWAYVREGRFREDLFYRLNVFPIRVPPLRERREDIPLFVERFIEKFCNRDGVPTKVVPAEVEAELMARSWPGNIRELENAVEMAVIRSRDRQKLELADFPVPVDAGSHTRTAEKESFRELVSRFEGELIAQALRRSDGNKSQAAADLGIKRTTLVEKLKKLERATCDWSRTQTS